MRILFRIAFAFALTSGLQSGHLRAEERPRVAAPAAPAKSPSEQSAAKEVLTDAAIIAALILASTMAYKAMGKPCACPEDLMRNGRRCGGNSAWARAGGYKPLCYPTDILPAMITNYREQRVVPPLR